MQYVSQAFSFDCGGLAIFSRFPVTDVLFQPFKWNVARNGVDLFEYNLLPSGTLTARMLVDGVKISVVSTHLCKWVYATRSTLPHGTPYLPRNIESYKEVREYQVGQVLDIVTEEEKSVDLVVLGTDLNAISNSTVYKSLTDAGFVDVVAKKHENPEAPSLVTWGNSANTWNQNTIFWTPYRIDYIMTKGSYAYCKSAGIIDIKTQDGGEVVSVSDHSGVVADIELSTYQPN